MTTNWLISQVRYRYILHPREVRRHQTIKCTWFVSTYLHFLNCFIMTFSLGKCSTASMIHGQLIVNKYTFISLIVKIDFFNLKIYKVVYNSKAKGPVVCTLLFPKIYFIMEALRNLNVLQLNTNTWWTCRNKNETIEYGSTWKAKRVFIQSIIGFGFIKMQISFALITCSSWWMFSVNAFPVNAYRH